MTSTFPAAGNSLVTALQLGDGTFPSGRYTLSHGLESFVQQRRIRTPLELRALLEDYLTLVVGPTDATATAAAAHAVAAGDAATVVEVDRLLFSLKTAHEAAGSSRRTGHSLLELACALSENPILAGYAAEVRSGRAPGNYAVVFGVLARAWGLSARQAATVEVYAFAAALLGVALRIFGIDHTFAQRTLHELGPLLSELGEQAAATPYPDMGGFAPLIDIMQMRHERAHVRLFGS